MEGVDTLHYGFRGFWDRRTTSYRRRLPLLVFGRVDGDRFRKKSMSRRTPKTRESGVEAGGVG